MALQEVVHVLRDTRTICTILTHTFPQGKEEVGTIQQVNLINEDKRIPAFRPVHRDTV